MIFFKNLFRISALKFKLFSFFFSLLLGSILQFFWCFNFKCSRWNPVLPCLNNLTNPTFATWVVFSIPTLLSSVIVKSWKWTFSYLSRLQSTTQTSQIGIGTARKKVQKTHSNQKFQKLFNKKVITDIFKKSVWPLVQDGPLVQSCGQVLFGR